MKHCILIAGLAAALIPATETRAEAITALPLTTMAWSTTPEGVGFAPLLGDRFAEPYMAMVKLPAGLVSPAHRKSADMFGLVVSGTMTHVAADADPASGTVLAAGSYYRIPGGLSHVSSCLSQDDCVTFLYQPGPFDFLVTEP